jgi:hypothetical protein
MGFALQVNVYLNDVSMGEVSNKTALKITGVPAGQVGGKFGGIHFFFFFLRLSCGVE